jgi:hypothetical protein
MRLLRRLLAAVAGTAIALAIAVALALWDISTDLTGEPGDTAAQGAAGSPVVAALLFIFYLALANLMPLFKTRPYISAAASVATATFIFVSIPSVVWAVSDRSVPELGPVLGGLLMGVCWLTPGAMAQVPILHGLGSGPSKQAGPGHA